MYVWSRRVVVLLGTLILLLLQVSCSSKPLGNGKRDIPGVYTGEFEIFKPSTAERVIDTVRLTFQDQEYTLDHETHQTGICESSGIYALTTGVTLKTAEYRGSTCDSLRVPKGLFSLEMHGDSLYLERHDDSAILDAIYTFRLRK